ncbi:MAG TPA: sodium:alanine symporter family protein [Firmicutes bacterium]|nr:sodium:alanine symporter family protein [Bacillota bacterium]
MPEILQQIHQVIHQLISGPAMLLWMVGVGIFLSVRTRFFQFTHFIDVFKTLFHGIFKTKPKSGHKSGITPFQSLTTALAGTLGTGNIVGVATALAAGGPGAVFWMWVSAFFGMVTKYAEIVLAVRYRKTNAKGEYTGGPMYYMEHGLHWKKAGSVYAVLCILASFGIGNTTQANAAVEALHAGFGFSKGGCAFLLAFLAGLVMLGGIRRIGKITEKFVPVMAVFYTGAAFVVLFQNAGAIPEAFVLIFRSAFNFRAVGGGITGYFVLRSLRYGVSRGVFSNEAGLGSSSIAHAAADTDSPVRQGMWGIFEVFVDTIVMCTLTTLVILTSGLWNSGLDGATLTLAAFTQALGKPAGWIIAVSTALFAFAALLGWSYYGEKCMEYLFHGKRGQWVYRFCYIALAWVGGLAQLELVWDIADTLNGLMAIPNLAALLLLSGEVKHLTENYIATSARSDKILRSSKYR